MPTQTHPPHAPAARSSEARRRQLLAPALSLCFTLFLSCSGSPSANEWPLQTIHLTGNTAKLRTLDGRWYDDSGWLMVEVRSAHPSRLSLRLPPGFAVADGRAVGDEIHFSVFLEGASAADWSLRLVGADSLVVIRLGAEPSSWALCTPRLRRPSLRQLLFWKAEDLKREIAEVYHRTCEALGQLFSGVPA